MVKMSGRAFVLIFTFWALLTIITPTLIFLSASAKHGLDDKGEQNGRTTWPRRMMGYEQEQLRVELQTPAAAPEPSHISSGNRIRIAHDLKSEHLNRVFHGVKREGESDVGEARLSIMS